MSNDVTKKTPLELDSIDDFDDTVAGSDGGGGGFLPAGMVTKFTKTERWEDRNGADITGKIVLHLDSLRTEVRWGKDNLPVAPPRVLGPGEQYRDVDAINETIPKDEWLPGFDKGQLRGPVQNQNVLLFGDLGSMERFVWPSLTSTIGSSIAVREVNDKVKRMRQFRGARVFAKVRLSKCRFPTRYGERQRPHLEIVGWVEPTEHGLAQIDPRLLSDLATPNPAPGAKTVAEPSLREEMNDSVPWK